MTGETMESAMAELNAKNETIITVKANSATMSKFQINSTRCMFYVQTMGLLTYHCISTLHTIIFCLLTLQHQFGPHALGFCFHGVVGISLTDSWAAMAVLQFDNQGAVGANHRFLAHPGAGVAWGDISATAQETSILPDLLIGLKQHWESLPIEAGKCGATCNECF